MTQPTSPPPIPLVDLHWQYAQVAEAVAARWQRILSTCDFILGQEVAQFEEAFSAFTGVPHCVAVANGTDALELLLRAHQVEPATRSSSPRTPSSPPLSPWNEPVPHCGSLTALLTS